MSGSRLDGNFGRWINQNTPLHFSFDGQQYKGFEGDVITSALAGSDCWLLSRSFKYHRPRGTMSMAGHDANSIVGLPYEPNIYADLRQIEEGMQVHPVNVSGSLRRDNLAVLDKLGRFLPVGFYYRAFFKPRGAWKFWEPIIRRIAGLGTLDKNTPHNYYDKAYGFYDVVVVGSGAAGLSAALEAAQHCNSVLIIEESAQAGGSLNWQRSDGEGVQSWKLRTDLVQSVTNTKNIELMTSAVASGLFTDGWLSVMQGSRFYKIRAGSVVVASGLIEQPAVFRNNDRPGVLLASAAQRLMRLYGVVPGADAVILTANEAGYAAALDCLEAGTRIQAVVDMRQRADAAGKMHKRIVTKKGIQIYYGSAIFEVTGRDRVTGIVVSAIDNQGNATGDKTVHMCDCVLTSIGWTPNSSLLWPVGVGFSYDKKSNMHRPTSYKDDIVYAAGGVRGVLSLAETVQDGTAVGKAAATGVPATQCALLFTEPTGEGNHPYPIVHHEKGKNFVDFDEDLQIKDIVEAQKHGFRDVQLTKRYSTLGMGPSQGRHSNVNAIRIIARQSEQPEDGVGATTTRPPYRSEKFGLLAGRSFDPIRRTAMHHRHEELGATFMPAGAWQRPAYYSLTKGVTGAVDINATVAAEVSACRQNLGIIDVSTLGGLDIRGPDAAEFVNRMYTWAYLKQKVNRARYLLMTDESGVVVDDGVACRLHENHYYLTATTSGVDGVYREMLRRNAQWQLDVDIANVSAAYAGVNLAGPKSRQALQVLTDLDLSNEAFGYMGVFEAKVAGIPARLLRVGFVGELGYEIHVPASQGEALWDALMERGKEFSIQPFGVEAQRVMRLEKGHIIIGQDTDGLTTPHEADMEWALGKNKPYYLGKHSVDIQSDKGVNRRLVGFRLRDAHAPCPKECHLVICGDEITGRVTSAVHSPTLDAVIGLAYVAMDQSEHGSEFTIRVDGKMVQAVVATHPFYDPEGLRQEVE